VDLSRYLDLFLAEAREHLAQAEGIASRLCEIRDDPVAVRDLFRHLHSLKGMAASMGYPALTELAHAAEDLLEVFRSGASRPEPHHRSWLLETLACLAHMVDQAERKETVEDARSSGLVAQIRAEISRGFAPTPPPSVEGPMADSAMHVDLPPAPPRSPQTSGLATYSIHLVFSRAVPFPGVLAALALGNCSRLGRIVRNQPPLAALRTGRFDGSLTIHLETSCGRETLEAETERWEGVLSRSIALEPPAAAEPHEPSNPPTWVRVRADILDSLLEEALDLMLEQGRLSDRLAALPDFPRPEMERCKTLLRRLYGNLNAIRLVPFEVVAHRVARGAREVAREMGREVHFEILGRDVRLERSLLESLVDPLLHILRNAVDHGIEEASERVAAGKDAVGSISIRLLREGDRVRLLVEDDGRGMRPEELRRVAVERGFLPNTQAEALSDEEALMLITLPGLSTARRASTISGRGVGMDIVRSAVESLGGLVTIHSEPGRGSRIELTLPPAIAVIQALMVRIAGDLFAVPIASVRETLHLDESGSEKTREGLALSVRTRTFEPVDLADLLGLSSPRAASRAGVRSILVCPVAGRDQALVVDEVLGRREIVVRPLHAPLHALREYAGAALLEDGTVALVLDPVHLAPMAASELPT